MNIFSQFPYVNGQSLPIAPPLGRFLPPINAGVITAWLSDHTPPGAWVLDPFGTSPLIAVEAARSGRRVIVSANNPVARFMLEAAASPPTNADFQAGMAELSNARKDGERLETHMQNLYQTECSNCRKTIIAQAFIWDRHSGIVTGKLIHCPHCNDHGEREATPADADRAGRWAQTEGLHRSRALERIASRDDPDREHAEEALNTYLPRAVYAFGTLINKIELLSIAPERRRALTALVISAFDQCNSLWAYPLERPRPRILSTPNRYLEYSVWQSLEDSIAYWQNDQAPVPVTIFPQLPPESGGLCIFEGRLRDLSDHLEEIHFSASIATLPRPNQAYWTLSALWAGWLWGRDAVAPFKSVLKRKRYDWQWHAEALRSAFENLHEALPKDVPFYVLLAEAEPSFVTAAMSAAQIAGFDLSGIAMRTIHDPLQIEWKRSAKTTDKITPTPILRDRLESFLAERAEPAAYFPIHVAAVSALAEKNALGWGADLITNTESAIQRVIDQPPFKRWEAKNTIESGFWGLINLPADSIPLVDRVEKIVVSYLLKHHGCTFDEIEAETDRELPGLLTPSRALIRAVLDSYGMNENGWWIRTEDFPAARRNDLAEMKMLIEKLCPRLSYTTTATDNALTWGDPNKPDFVFYVTVSAVVGKMFRENPYPRERSILILPGGRAGLLAYKLKRDPALKEKAQGWRFLKFRHLRSLLNIPLLTRETWLDQLSADAIKQDDKEQMMLF